MINIIQFLEVADIEKAKALLFDLTNDKLEEVYCEAVLFKHKYKLAFSRLDNELNMRKDAQINRNICDCEECLDKHLNKEWEVEEE